jgi:hypothetical protein
MEPHNDYVFAGWYTISNNTKTLLSSTYSYTFTASTSSLTLTALWVEHLDITIDPDINALSYTITQNLATDGVELVAQDAESYTWDGWYDSSNNKTASKTLTISYNDSYKKLIDQSSDFTGLPTYTAKWIQSGIIVNENNSNWGSSSIDTTTTPYTITAVSETGYDFVSWERNGEYYNDTNPTPIAENETTATYTAIFAPSTNIEYTVNIHLQNLNDDDYTPGSSTIYNTGTTGSNIAITPASQTGYVFKEARIDNVIVTADGNDQYQLMILADGTAEIDFYYDRKTINVSYHNNNGSNNSTPVAAKWDHTTENVDYYLLKTIANATWYDNMDLSGTAYAYATESMVENHGNNDNPDYYVEVWACYNGNNNLDNIFTFSPAGDLSYYKATYKGTIEDAEIVIPDYYNDIPVKMVNVDNLYNAGYTSLSMPSTLKFIEYGTYQDKGISWIILTSNIANGKTEYKLLSENTLGYTQFDDDGTFTSYEDSSIKAYLEGLKTTCTINTTISLLSSTEYSAYIIPTLIITGNNSAWWLSDVMALMPGMNWVHYVNEIPEDSLEQVSTNYHYVRPTITITL